MTSKLSEHAPIAFEPLELRQLATAMCDGHIRSEQLQHLETMLSTHSEARKMYIDFMDVHTGLDWEITSKMALPVDNDYCDGDFVNSGDSGDSMQSKVERKSTERKVLGLPYKAFAFLAASLVGVSLMGWWTLVAFHSEEGVARVVDLGVRSSWNLLNVAGELVSRSVSESDPQIVLANETIHLRSGQLRIRFHSGVAVILDAPAEFQVISPMRARALQGKLVANVPRGAEGFTIDTVQTTVVDLGTSFGLEVNDQGQTDVVVFQGKVDLQYGPGDRSLHNWSQRLLTMGEALRVDKQGTASRIVSIDSNRFASSMGIEPQSPVGPVVIRKVHDNLRGIDRCNYYEIVRGGMAEDARAFVDRPEHEWNGLEASGMPAYLVGGDFIRTFNNDKVSHNMEVFVSLAIPARLYVLFDDRVSAPSWLRENFRDTGDGIGLDLGKFQWQGRLDERRSPGIGPGISIDETLSVWVRDIEKPGIVRLGATEAPDHNINMYGIVAVPFASEHNSSTDEGSIDRNSSDWQASRESGGRYCARLQ